MKHRFGLAALAPRTSLFIKLLCIAVAAAGSLTLTSAAPGARLARWLAQPETASKQARVSPWRDAGAPVAARTEGKGAPWLSLEDGVEIPGDFAKSAPAVEPLALSMADFDEDGVADLVAGYRTDSGGTLSIARGNVDAISPSSKAAQTRRADGTFTDAPYLAKTSAFALAAAPDFVVAGDFDGDKHADVVTARAGATSVFFSRGDGHGHLGEATKVDVGGKITALASGELGAADGLDELVVGVARGERASLLVFGGSGGALANAPESIALPGRATSLAFGQLDAGFESDLAVAAGGKLVLVHGGTKTAETISTGFAIAAVVAGDFVGDRNFELAMLGEDGAVRLRDRAGAVSAWGEPVANAVARDGRTPILTRARVSTLPHDSLVVADPTSSHLSVLLGDARDNQTSAPRVGAESKAITLDLDGAPVAVATGRMNADGLSDLAVLRAGKVAPIGIVTGSFTLTVDSAFDSDDNNPGDGLCEDEGGQCTLRAAIQESNSNSGSTEIDFAIGTGSVSIGLTGRLDSISDTVLIDATTQPGFEGTPLVEIAGDGTGKGDAGFDVIQGFGTVIRGFVVNGWSGPGVRVTSGASETTIETCFIGTNDDGTIAVPNGTHGVDANGSVTVGGVSPGEGNLISGNNGNGVYLTGGASGSAIAGNAIGLDVFGNGPVGNGGWGVYLDNASSVEVGDPVSLAGGNLVGANGSGGVLLANESQFVGVDNNIIGTSFDRSASLPNGGPGISVDALTTDGTVANNTIANNGGPGVQLLGMAGIIGNDIFSNSGLGIDVGATGVTMNDSPDDDGAVNFPVITSAEFDGKGAIAIAGTLDAEPDKDYRIEFFTNGAADPTGYGEGENYIGFANVTTDNLGHASFAKNVLSGPDNFLTATASILGPTARPQSPNGLGSAVTTSEFSLAFPITGLPEPTADLKVTVSDAPDPVVAGQNITYTIRAQNFVGTAQNVLLVDTLPPNTTFVSFQAPSEWSVTTPSGGGTGSVTASRQTFDTDEVADTFILVVKVGAGTAPGTVITDEVSITSDTDDLNPADNTDSTDTTVSDVPPTLADLRITKSADASTALPGDEISYTLTVTNAGPATATGVNVSDTLPANTTFVSASAPAGWEVSAPSAGGTGTVVFAADSVANGASFTFTIVVRVNNATPSGTTVANTATVSATGTSDPNTANDSATANVSVGTQPSADVSLILSGTPNPVAPGGTITYTIVATNDGPTNTTDVAITFPVPSGTTFASATASTDGTCTTPSAGGTGTVRCTWPGTTPVGASRTATVVVRVSTSASDGSTISANASVSSGGVDLDLSNNTATLGTSVTIAAGENSADLSVTTTSPGSQIDTGEQVTYTITVANAGPATAENVVVSGSTPAGTRLVSITPSQGSASGTPAGEQGAFSVALGDIPAGSRATITIVVNVIAPGGSTFSNTVVVSSDTNDPSASNNTATSSTTTVVAGNDTRLDWDPPLPCDDDCLNPPLHLQTTTSSASASDELAKFTAPRTDVLRNTVIGYNIYRSNQPNVAATPGNFFTSVPATTTTIVAPTAPGGSFFTVTAMYPNGESSETNAASGGIPEPTITGFKINGTSVIVDGSGFTDSVQVFVDGIPFAKAAKVKRDNTRINQKGKLITGQKVAQYLQQQGGVVLVSVLNTDTGIGTFLYRSR